MNRMILWTLLLFCLPLYCFKTLQDAREYAQSVPEFPAYKGSMLNPDYTVFHRSIKPGYVGYFFSPALEFLSLKKKPSWRPDDFVQAVNSVLKLYREKGRT